MAMYSQHGAWKSIELLVVIPCQLIENFDGKKLYYLYLFFLQKKYMFFPFKIFNQGAIVTASSPHILGMSCPTWQWHRTGYSQWPVQTLPVVPLWCYPGRCSQTVKALKLLPVRTSASATLILSNKLKTTGLRNMEIWSDTRESYP